MWSSSLRIEQRNTACALEQVLVGILDKPANEGGEDPSKVDAFSR